MDQQIGVIRSGEQGRAGRRWSTRRARRARAAPSRTCSRRTGSPDDRVVAREPDTWSFVRPYHEVAVILRGDADVVADDGTVHTLGPGDVLVTPKGSAGTWRIRETIVKSFTILEVD